MNPDTATIPELDVERRLDRVAAGALHGPLAVALGLLIAGQLACWAPQYLAWPLFADHDVFATMAQEWDAGHLPYRATLSNNFPGTIYLFWVVGKVTGWGRPAAFYAVDAAFVGVLGLALIGWSARRFGRVLPGLAGYATIATYYLGLDYTQAAQRDWQGPLCAVLGLLAAEALPGRSGRLLAAVGAALGVAIRPQTVLFWPAMALAVVDGDRRPFRASLEWASALTIGIALAFAPLAMAGVLGDFARSLRVVAPGGGYNKATAARVAAEFLKQLTFKNLALLAALGLLGRGTAARTRRSARTWALAWLAVALYRPLSPMPHAYLSHPLALVEAVVLAVVVALLLESPALGPAARLAAVLLVLGLGATIKPRFVNPIMSRDALATLRSGAESNLPPTGYRRNPEVPLSALYPWDDYRDLLLYLRQQTDPGTPVANALMGLPAVCGEVGRRSAFPAESIAWLYTVRKDDQDAFARALDRADDSVVVWSPAEHAEGAIFRKWLPLDQIVAVIRSRFEPAAKFGAIEVWRRKP